ncbi:Arc family DNA-binding protein [Proteus mirabilis]|uniref:Arc family DNA-binding protein n=1 Tax=Proteus mirabilis TaxID=584 RepID=UPI0034D3EDC5
MTTKRNPQFNVRISPELKEEIVALAEKNKRPINAEINAALEAWVEQSKVKINANRFVITADMLKEEQKVILVDPSFFNIEELKSSIKSDVVIDVMNELNKKTDKK